MGRRPRSYFPSPWLKWCFALLIVLIIITSLVLVVGWSAGWNIRGIEVWKGILVGSVTFLIGILVGATE